MFACTTFADSHAVPSLRRSVDWEKVLRSTECRENSGLSRSPAAERANSYTPAVEAIIARTSAGQARNVRTILTQEGSSSELRCALPRDDRFVIGPKSTQCRLPAVACVGCGVRHDSMRRWCGLHAQFSLKHRALVDDQTLRHHRSKDTAGGHQLQFTRQVTVPRSCPATAMLDASTVASISAPSAIYSKP